MPQIGLTWADLKATDFAARIAKLNVLFPKVMPQEINRVGAKVKTQVIRNLRAQTGLKRAVIVKAIGNPEKARSGKFSYAMTTRGGYIRLKYFRARESKKGVVAFPFGKRTLFKGTFMKGGAFPNRVDVEHFNGQVWQRILGKKVEVEREFTLANGQKKRRIVKVEALTQVRSGVRIPVEMITGQSLKAFNDMAGPLLRQRITTVLDKLVP